MGSQTEPCGTPPQDMWKGKVASIILCCSILPDPECEQHVWETAREKKRIDFVKSSREVQLNSNCMMSPKTPINHLLPWGEADSVLLWNLTEICPGELRKDSFFQNHRLKKKKKKNNFERWSQSTVRIRLDWSEGCMEHNYLPELFILLMTHDTVQQPSTLLLYQLIYKNNTYFHNPAGQNHLVCQIRTWLLSDMTQRSVSAPHAALASHCVDLPSLQVRWLAPVLLYS